MRSQMLWIGRQRGDRRPGGHITLPGLPIRRNDDSGPVAASKRSIRGDAIQLARAAAILVVSGSLSLAAGCANRENSGLENAWKDCRICYCRSDTYGYYSSKHLAGTASLMDIVLGSLLFSTVYLALVRLLGPGWLLQSLAGRGRWRRLEPKS